MKMIRMTLGLVLLVCLGCSDDPNAAIDTSGAEFSTQEDYEQYDRDMIEKSRGQSE